jgi:hypothetical protein
MRHFDRWLPQSAAFASLLALTVAVFTTGGNQAGQVSWSVLASAAAAAVAALSSYLVVRSKRSRQRKGQVFLIYSYEDTRQARHIAEWLRENGLSPWMASEELEPGMPYEEAIKSALSESAAALVLVTNNLDPESPWIRSEIEGAKARMWSEDPAYQPVIPILLGPSRPPASLGDVQAVDGNDEEQLRRLGESLRRILQGPATDP